MKIGIFCGSFDPPHLGHLILAGYSINQFELSKVIFIPSFLSVTKEKHFANCEDRYNMLRLMTKNNPLLTIDRFEIDRNKKTYTYETLFYLKEKYRLSKDQFFLFIGSDWLDNLDQWKNFDIIKNLTNFIIFNRNSSITEIEEKISKIGLDKESYLILNRQIDISSTYIRKLISEFEDFSYLVSESVYKYIIEKGLYQ